MHFLVVDDEKNALNILQEAVKEAVPAAEIHAFDNPAKALEFAKDTKCEIAFLDIQMREMNGIILAKKIKEIHPKTNIVFVTGYPDYTDEAFALHASGYVYKPVTPEKIENEMEHLRHAINWKDKGIFVKTFGDFEIIVNDAKVTFARSKSKELLAYLVDKKGKSATRKELAEILFDNQPYTRQIQDHLQKVIKELQNALETAGAGSILQKGINSYSVNTDAFTCDYYNYEKDNASPEDINRFQGEYMNQYSWAKNTLKSLTR